MHMSGARYEAAIALVTKQAVNSCFCVLCCMTLHLPSFCTAPQTIIYFSPRASRDSLLYAIDEYQSPPFSPWYRKIYLHYFNALHIQWSAYKFERGFR